MCGAGGVSDARKEERAKWKRWMHSEPAFRTQLSVWDKASWRPRSRERGCSTVYTQARNLLALPREHPDIELILGEVLHVRTKVLADQVLEDCRHGGSLLALTG